jgi:hypothetical protein
MRDENKFQTIPPLDNFYSIIFRTLLEKKYKKTNIVQK